MHRNHKNFKSLYGFGGLCLKIKDVCMDFEVYFKVHSLVSVHPKNIILGQMTNLNMIFYVVASVYRFLLKFETRPSFLLNFGTNVWQAPMFLQSFRLNCNPLVTLYLSG